MAKSIHLAIVVGAIMSVAAAVYGALIFSQPQNVTSEPEEILLYYQLPPAKPHLVRVSDMRPNSYGYFMYPSSYSISDSADAYQRFLLIRLPSWMGGANDSITSYRAYSAIGLSDHCILRYWPQEGRFRVEDDCSGDMFRPVDGYLYVKGGNPVLLQDDIGLPELDLTVDNLGYIAVKPPVLDQDRNGAIGIGRSMSQVEIDKTTAFLKGQQAREQEYKFHAPSRLSTGEYAEQVDGDWYEGSVGYQAIGQLTYYPVLRYQFCNCSSHDMMLKEKTSMYSSMYRLGDELILATATTVSSNGTNYDYEFDFYMDPYQVEIRTAGPFEKEMRMVLDTFFNGAPISMLQKTPTT